MWGYFIARLADTIHDIHSFSKSWHNFMVTSISVSVQEAALSNRGKISTTLTVTGKFEPMKHTFGSKAVSYTDHFIHILSNDILQSLKSLFQIGHLQNNK